MCRLKKLFGLEVNTSCSDPQYKHDRYSYFEENSKPNLLTLFFDVFYMKVLATKANLFEVVESVSETSLSFLCTVPVFYNKLNFTNFWENFGRWKVS